MIGARLTAGKLATGALALLVLGFLLAPILVIGSYAFSDSSVQVWPIRTFTTNAFIEVWRNEEVRQALWLSLKIAGSATAIATVLATMLALLIHNYNFNGRNLASFVVVMPIALPGIITGIAMNSYFIAVGVPLSTLTLMLAHSTFCIVVIYNNVLARLRRLPRSLAEAAADLGAGTWRTFAKVTFPMIRSALVSGGLLAFALSFDEVIVSTFTAGVQITLPLWIFGAIRMGQHLNQVNALVLMVILFTLVPVLISQRLAGDAGGLHR